MNWMERGDSGADKSMEVSEETRADLVATISRRQNEFSEHTADPAEHAAAGLRVLFELVDDAARQDYSPSEQAHLRRMLAYGCAYTRIQDFGQEDLLLEVARTTVQTEVDDLTEQYIKGELSLAWQAAGEDTLRIIKSQSPDL